MVRGRLIKVEVRENKRKHGARARRALRGRGVGTRTGRARGTGRIRGKGIGGSDRRAGVFLRGGRLCVIRSVDRPLYAARGFGELEGPGLAYPACPCGELEGPGLDAWPGPDGGAGRASGRCGPSMGIAWVEIRRG